MQYQEYYDESDGRNEHSPEGPIDINHMWDVCQTPGCAHTESPLRSMALHSCASVYMDLTHAQPQMYDAQENTFAQEPSWNLNANINLSEESFKAHMHNVYKKGFAEISTQDTYARINRGKFNVCGICKKSFSKNKGLERHLRVHTGEKPYECNVCGKAFSRKDNMLRHYRIHTGEKPYACNLCSEAFTHRISLNRHAWIHTGVKPYVCGICNKAFTQKTHLNRHELIHSEE